MESLWEILVILVLVLLNGFFAGAEIAILTSRRSRLEQAAQGGSRSAQLALQLSSDANRFLSTVQVGITLVGTLAAAYGGARLVDQLGAWLAQSPVTLIAKNGTALALVLVTGALASASLVLGELLPKRIALLNAEKLATLVAWPMFVLSVVTRPMVALLAFVTSACLWLLRIRTDNIKTVTVGDIEHLIQTGTQEGILDSAEQEVAMEALKLGDRRVKDIMRPRVDIDAMDIDTPADEVGGVVAMSGFSRLPVYEGSLDHILGFVYIKDVFQQYFLGRPLELRKMLHTALFVPASLPLDKLLTMFQAQRGQLAVVLDEFGGTEGIVTLEDVLEELVGEIHDEHRRDQEQLIVRRDEVSWLVDGRLPIHELREILPERARPNDVPESVNTISGMVLSRLERMAKIGDVVQWDSLRIEVVDMDGTRIDRVLIQIPEAPASKPS